MLNDEDRALVLAEADRRWPHPGGHEDQYPATALAARRLSFRQGAEWALANIPNGSAR